MVSKEEGISQADSLVGVHPDEIVSTVEDAFRELVEDESLGAVLFRVFKSALEQTVLLNNESEAILHLHVEEGQTLVLLNKQLEALEVVFLLRVEHQFQGLELRVLHCDNEFIDLLRL